jgi:hypothetical protein
VPKTACGFADILRSLFLTESDQAVLVRDTHPSEGLKSLVALKVRGQSTHIASFVSSTAGGNVVLSRDTSEMVTSFPF